MVILYSNLLKTHVVASAVKCRHFFDLLISSLFGFLLNFWRIWKDASSYNGFLFASHHCCYLRWVFKFYFSWALQHAIDGCVSFCESFSLTIQQPIYIDRVVKWEEKIVWGSKSNGLLTNGAVPLITKLSICLSQRESNITLKELEEYDEAYRMFDVTSSANVIQSRWNIQLASKFRLHLAPFHLMASHTFFLENSFGHVLCDPIVFN